MGKRRKLKKGTRVRAQHKTQVTLPPVPFRGDHGTGTQAASAGTVLVPIKDDPNRRAYAYHVNSVDVLEGKLTLRQLQAARAIQRAYMRNEVLSSGNPLKEPVDGTSQPDKSISAMVDAQSDLHRCMYAVRRSERRLVEAVCFHDIRLGAVSREGYPRALARFRIAMTRVADHLRF